ncbi:MAG TPA: AAA family ATPase [Planctomycetaceae bacterium]|nr:AAA family ATPase [Planctomycetaceae bacterium]
MNIRKVLVQWIGHSDLRALSASLPAAKANEILDRIGGSSSDADGLGPTKTLLETQEFDEIRLLSNYDKNWNTWFKAWLKKPVKIIEVELNKPTDYAAIFEITNRELNAIKEVKQTTAELCLHLSPGTPAMIAVMVLLGKTRFPATFYETSRNGKSWITHVPFDLIDIIPDVLRNPDVYLQHLASESPAEVEGFEDIIGNSSAIRESVGRAKRAAIRSVSVLLLGESGTGKEMFAQAIHKASPRRDQPFIAINCAALPQTLLESELFGHAKGAFTGAAKERLGAFEAANGGTIFLDEIGECELETQAKLLRVLQPITGEGAGIRKFSRIGEERERTVDVRILAATNRNLHHAIQKHQFRDDLYYRLAAVTINLPALKERKSDLPVLTKHLLGVLNRQFALEDPTYQYKILSASANKFVKEYSWPGNVRQLYNALVQAVVLTDGETIGRNELAAALGEFSGRESLQAAELNQELGDGFHLEEHLKSVQKHYLEQAMLQSRGVKVKAAHLLGMKNYQTLDAQMKRLGIRQDWDNTSN